MMDGYGMGNGAWMAMMVVWLLLLVVIVIAVLRIFPGRNDRSSAVPPPPIAPTERPLEILDRRLASGEIDLETYDRLRARLVEAAQGR